MRKNLVVLSVIGIFFYLSACGGEENDFNVGEGKAEKKEPVFVVPALNTVELVDPEPNDIIDIEAGDEIRLIISGSLKEETDVIEVTGKNRLESIPIYSTEVRRDAHEEVWARLAEEGRKPVYKAYFQTLEGDDSSEPRIIELTRKIEVLEDGAYVEKSRESLLYSIRIVAPTDGRESCCAINWPNKGWSFWADSLSECMKEKYDWGDCSPGIHSGECFSVFSFNPGGGKSSHISWIPDCRSFHTRDN